MAVQRRLAAILAADVAGYSRLMGEDEEGTLATLTAHLTDLIEPCIAEHRGRVVKTTGDGLLAEFASVVDAVRCAVAFQEGMAERNTLTPEDRRIEFRIGVNLGDVIVQDDDVYGEGVNIAARLEGLAEPGGICISGTVFDQLGKKLDIVIEDLGPQSVKNITEPIRTYRVCIDGVTSATEGDAEKPPPDKPSIAVLAFDNMSGDPEPEYVSDCISEDIITDLSKLSVLHVIARNSSFAYKHRAFSVPEVARQLGVRYVLEGSVRKSGERVRVTAQLVDSVTGGHVWADRFDRKLTDIFVVQDELTQEIVSALKVTLTTDEQERLVHRRTIDPGAYNLFLRGREQAWLHSRSGNIEARSLLGRAVEIDPGYAAAHARIAFTRVIDFANGWSDEPERSLRIGLEVAQQAVTMDDEEPQAHFALCTAFVWSRKLDEALAAARRCLELEPNLAEGHIGVAICQVFRGEATAAIDTIDTYMTLDPLYPDIAVHFLAEARITLGQFDLAVDAINQRLKRNPDSATSYALLSSCYGHLGRIEKSRTAWAETLRIDPSFSIERRRQILPFRDPAEYERRIDGLRKAGLVE